MSLKMLKKILGVQRVMDEARCRAKDEKHAFRMSFLIIGIFFCYVINMTRLRVRLSNLAYRDFAYFSCDIFK